MCVHNVYDWENRLSLVNTEDTKVHQQKFNIMPQKV